MKPSVPRLLVAFLAATLVAHGAADYATPYLFSTLAGVSSIGSADGPGDQARFYSPRAIAVDAAGNTFVVDNGNHTIRKVTPAGVVTTFAGMPGIPGSADGTGAAARFDGPEDIVADTADNLYVTDAGNHTIRKITPAGVVTTFAGLAGVPGDVDGPGALARFFTPLGIALDPAGNLYVSEGTNHAIRKITPAGAVSTFARDLAFRDPYYYAIAVDAAGNAYVSLFLFRNYGNYYIDGVLQPEEVVSDIGFVTKIAPDGGRTFLRQTSVVLDPAAVRTAPGGVTDLLIEPSGQLLMAGFNRLTHLSLVDQTATTFSGSGQAGSADGPAGTACFSGLVAMAYGRDGTVHIADAGNNIIRKVSAAGAVTTVAGIALESASGSTDGTGAAARFANPTGTAVDAAGNVYVADPGTHCIRKITSAGVVTLFAGSPGTPGSADGTGTAARFRNPSGVAVDASGVVYVADTGNHTIRRITPGGETSTYAGTAGIAELQDGRGAAAHFISPRFVATDATGNVYVTTANTLRKITPDQMVSAPAGVDGGATGPAQFINPLGLAVDAGGTIYVAEGTYSTVARIRKITPSGTVTTFAGDDDGSADGNGAAARFHDPAGLAVDAAGNLFVADTFNQTIRKITPQGTVTTLAGLADSPGSTDGTGAEARFYYPTGIAANPAGTLYVTSGTTIRKGVLATGPVIATQPLGLTVVAGTSASFSVTAGGTPAPTFQWQRNGSAISGATGSSLTLSAAQSADAGDYTVVVSNELGSVTSAKATLTVTPAPIVTPPTVPAPTPSGSGGGGAPSEWFGLALLALGIVRCQRRYRAG